MVTRPSPRQAARARQGSLLLGARACPTPAAVATWLGALQAQDAASGMWSLGVRLADSRMDAIEAAFETGEILRTWPMRGTIHIVPAVDTRWMLTLTASRALRSSARQRELLGVDLGRVDRAVDVLMSALSGGRRLPRADALAALREGGLRTEGQAGYHALVYAAHVGAICIGPPIGRQQSFVRLDEWAPRQVELSREEALIELCWRYFRSHGPATVADFAGWTGLTLTDSRSAVAANEGRLVEAELGGVQSWMSAETAADLADGPGRQPVRALPGFDEFILGYKDRTLQVPERRLGDIVPGGNGVFRPTICSDGVAVATWRRTLRRDRIDVDVTPFAPPSASAVRAITAALARYGEFHGLPVRLTFDRT